MTDVSTKPTAPSRPRPVKTPKVVGTRRLLSPEESAATGLRDRWYPILPSRFVAAGEMVEVQRLGVDWLLFRDARGKLSMLEDRCAHRSAPLWVGQHLGDRVACKYRG